MANNQTRRIPPNTLRADLDAYAALQAIPNYSPANAAYAIPEITTARQSMENARVAEAQAAAALDAARDEAVAREWDFHNAMLGVKTQVEAQFGADSNEIQALGMKKKSEYARPTCRKPGNTGSNA